MLGFRLLSQYAVIPRKASKNAAGFDLCSAYDYIIPAKGKGLIKTDLVIKLPEGCYGRIAPRSGLAWNHFIDVAGGVIDPDYNGNVCVILYNFGSEPFVVERGQRVAQLICEKFESPEVEVLQEQPSTSRGDRGFGSTGNF